MTRCKRGKTFSISGSATTSTLFNCSRIFGSMIFSIVNCSRRDLAIDHCGGDDIRQRVIGRLLGVRIVLAGIGENVGGARQ